MFFASRHRAAWAQLAPSLELTPHDHAFEGRYRDFPVRLELDRGSHAILRVAFRGELPSDFALDRRGAPPGPNAKQDITVGDDALDLAVRIQGDNPAAVIRIMRSPGVADAARSFFEGEVRAAVRAEEIRLELQNPDLDAARSALSRAVALARHLETAGEAERARADAAVDAARSAPLPVERRFAPLPKPPIATPAAMTLLVISLGVVAWVGFFALQRWVGQRVVTAPTLSIDPAQPPSFDLTWLTKAFCVAALVFLLVLLVVSYRLFVRGEPFSAVFRPPKGNRHRTLWW